MLKLNSTFGPFRGIIIFFTEAQAMIAGQVQQCTSSFGVWGLILKILAHFVRVEPVSLQAVQPEMHLILFCFQFKSRSASP